MAAGSGKARAVVLASAATISVSSLLRELRRGEVPSVRIPIGAALMALALGSAAGPFPGAASALAVLAATSSLLYDPENLRVMLLGILRPNEEGK